MIDLHSHVLPGMDDGSKNVEESLAMLKASADQGIRCMAATSHFYPEENSPEVFLRRREAAFQQLAAARDGDLPHLFPGAEVYYFDGISRNAEIGALCIEGTSLLLLEMPFMTWSGRMVTEIRQLQNRSDTTVMLAHVERYLSYQKKNVWEELLDCGVLMHCNASFFLSWKTKRKALRMLKQGKIHFVASDCHNVTTRPPRIGEALKVIGGEGRNILEENRRRYLPEWDRYLERND